MKGLLIKDFKLMKNQKSFLILMLAASVYVTFALENASFIIAYMTFLYCIFVISTISYDEFDNGYAFLFTLPFSRKEYAIEKYFFGMLWCFAGVLVSTVIYIIGMRIKGTACEALEVVSASIIYFSIGIMVMAFALPIQLKYGNVKSGAAIVAVSILLAMVGYILCTLPIMDALLPDFIHMIETTSAGVLGGILLAVALVIMFISLLISMRVVEKREV